jgi:hypothetical protein
MDDKIAICRVEQVHIICMIDQLSIEKKLDWWKIGLHFKMLYSRNNYIKKTEFF